MSLCLPITLTLKHMHTRTHTHSLFLLSSWPSSYILLTTLNLELNKLSSWFKSDKLSLNINKTNCIYFKNINSKHVLQYDIFIDDIPIIDKEVTKFLGVMIDSNLT